MKKLPTPREGLTETPWPGFPFACFLTIVSLAVALVACDDSSSSPSDEGQDAAQIESSETAAGLSDGSYTATVSSSSTNREQKISSEAGSDGVSSSSSIDSSSVADVDSSPSGNSSSSQTVLAGSSTSISSSTGNPQSHYDCNIYKCVTTEFLNQEMLAAGKYGELLDIRDSQVYRTIEIGEQTWMAQNLNFEYKYGFSSFYTVYENICYDEKEENCSKYGRLYTWAAAVDSIGLYSDNCKGCGNGSFETASVPARGVCPEGFHLPSKSEFEGMQLTDVLYAGYCGEDKRCYSLEGDPLREESFFWTSTRDYKTSYVLQNGVMKDWYRSKFFSIRCVKDH